MSPYSVSPVWLDTKDITSSLRTSRDSIYLEKLKFLHLHKPLPHPWIKKVPRKRPTVADPHLPKKKISVRCDISPAPFAYDVPGAGQRRSTSTEKQPRE